MEYLSQFSRFGSPHCGSRCRQERPRVLRLALAFHFVLHAFHLLAYLHHEIGGTIWNKDSFAVFACDVVCSGVQFIPAWHIHTVGLLYVFAN